VNEPAKSPALAERKPGLFRRFADMFSPRSEGQRLTRAGQETGLPPEDSRSAGIVEQSQVADAQSAGYVRRGRGALLASLASIGSAALVAWFFRATNLVPMLPRTVLTIGAVLTLAAGSLALIRWRAQLLDDDRTRLRIVNVLLWIGVCWALLAFL
jgi:hypothetical protein